MHSESQSEKHLADPPKTLGRVELAAKALLCQGMIGMLIISCTEIPLAWPDDPYETEDSSTSYTEFCEWVSIWTSVAEAKKFTFAPAAWPAL